MAKVPVKPLTVDEYIASFEPGVRAILRKIRAVVRAAAPEAVEVISYRMPALRRNGILIYYAAFRNHIGFYPPVRGDARLEKAASVYAGEKGNLWFPYSEPMPYELIGALTALRARQDSERARTGRTKTRRARTSNRDGA